MPRISEEVRAWECWVDERKRGMGKKINDEEKEGRGGG